MSQAELRARLSLQREADGREQGQRRERILGEKREKEQLLQEHQEAIELHSKALAQAASLRSGRTQSHTEWSHGAGLLTLRGTQLSHKPH